MKLWKSVECLSSTKDHKGNEGGKSMTPGPERIHRQPWGPLREVRLEPGWESSSTWGSGLSKWPWVKCCGLSRLSVDGSIQIRGAEFWWALRVSVKRGLWSRPWVQQDCWSQGRGHLGQVLTGLAGVSSRTCRLPAPQTDAEAATAWSSSGELSTVLCMIFLIRTITMSQQLQSGGKVQCRNDGKYRKLFEV